jgi:hypothetical protein
MKTFLRHYDDNGIPLTSSSSISINSSISIDPQQIESWDTEEMEQSIPILNGSPISFPWHEKCLTIVLKNGDRINFYGQDISDVEHYLKEDF